MHQTSFMLSCEWAKLDGHQIVTVIWKVYSHEEVGTHVARGFSHWCYWLGEKKVVFQCEIVQFYIEILGNCLDIKGCLSLFVTLYLAVLILQIILCEILLFLPWQARARHGKGKHVCSFRFITDIIQQKASWSTPLRVTAVLDCGVRSFPLRISKYVLVVVPISSIQIHLGSKELNL